MIPSIPEEEIFQAEFPPGRYGGFARKQIFVQICHKTMDFVQMR
jgi:hypothetical protein